MKFIVKAFALAAALAGWSAAAQADAPFQCTVVLDVASGAALVRDGACDRAAPPASSFKLPLAVMGFDAGILTGPTAPLWPYKAAYPAPKRDHKPVDPTIWERDSVLWYSRELTRRLGAKRFAGYVNAFAYGNRDVSGDAGKDNGLTQAWLASSLEISADQQADFVRRMLRGELPVSARAVDRTRQVIPSFKAGGWRVQGKTGSIWLRDKNGDYIRSMPVGWFVGWAQKGGRQLAFARLSVGTTSKERSGLHERELFLKSLPGLLANSGL